MHQQGTSTATVVVLIETADDRVIYKTWRNISNLKRFKTRRRAAYAVEYPGCKVSFGTALWENSYGAH